MSDRTGTWMRAARVVVVFAVVCMGLVHGVMSSASAFGQSGDPEVGDPEVGQQLDLPNYLEWNMCNGIPVTDNPLCAGPNSSGPALALETAVTSAPQKPKAIALEEICLDTYLRLVLSLGQYNYHAHYYWSNDNGQGACDDHGNAIFWKGGCDGSCWADASYPPSQQTGENDVRGYACGESQDFGFIACATHLSSNRDPLYSGGLTGPEAARLQQYSYRYYGNQVTAVQSFIGMGDFNLVPTDSGMSGWAGWQTNYREADVNFSDITYANGSDRRKLDYIWANRTGVKTCSRSADEYVVDAIGSGRSDHHRYRGYFTC